MLAHLRTLAQAISEQAGEMQAYGAALRGLLRAVGQSPALHAMVTEELERDAANNLACSLNAVQTDSFDRARDLLVASLRSAPTR